jgi:hypothetical protein
MGLDLVPRSPLNSVQMPANVNRGRLTYAIFSGIKADTSRRSVVERIAVMLLARDTQNPGVNIGEVLQVRSCFLEGYGAELRALQPAHQEFTRNTEIVDGKARK